VVEAPLALLQVQVERLSRHAVELLQPPLGEAPEALDAVDMALVIGELVRAVTYSKVLRVADIDQPVVTAPPVAVDDGVGRDPAADYGLKSDLLAVGHDLRVNAPLALEQAEDDGLTPGAAATPAAHPARAEIGLIHFDLAVPEGRLSLTFLGDAPADFAKDRDGRAVREPGQLGRLCGG